MQKDLCTVRKGGFGYCFLEWRNSSTSYLLGRHFTMHLATVATIWKVKSYSTYSFYQNSMLGSHTSCIRYDSNHKCRKTIANVNALYRLSLSDHIWEVPVPEEIVLLLKGLQTFLLNADQIKAWTNHDPILSQVKKPVLQGWVDTKDSNIQPYQCVERRNECARWMLAVG